MRKAKTMRKILAAMLTLMMAVSSFSPVSVFAETEENAAAITLAAETEDEIVVESEGEDAQATEPEIVLEEIPEQVESVDEKEDALEAEVLEAEPAEEAEISQQDEQIQQPENEIAVEGAEAAKEENNESEDVMSEEAPSEKQSEPEDETDDSSEDAVKQHYQDLVDSGSLIPAGEAALFVDSIAPEGINLAATKRNDGTQVYINMNSNREYYSSSGWTTRFTAQVGGASYTAYCGYPSLPAKGSGTYSLYYVNPDAFNNILVYAVLITSPSGPEPNSSLWAPLGEKASQYAYIHAVLGAVLEGSEWGLSAADKTAIWSVVNNLQTWADANKDYIKANYFAYLAGGNGTGHGGYQDIVWLEGEPKRDGSIVLKKSSGNVAITADNACYSIAGAKYGVFKSKANANANTGSVGTLTVDANGTSNKLPLEAGTYYIKETTAPTGFAKDTTVYTVTVEAGANQDVNVSDMPLTDPNAFRIQKESTGQIIQNGEAVFKVDYFDNYNTSGSPLRTWYVKTINGVARLQFEDYYVHTNEYSSDALFRSGDDIVIPLGSIRVTEVKSPNGYRKTEDSLTGVIKANADGTGGRLQWNAASPNIRYSIDSQEVTINNDKIPTINTELFAENGTHYTEATQTTLTDHIKLTDMDSYVGKTITVSGELHLKGEQAVLEVGGGKVTASKTVEITDKEQEVELAYSFDATEYKGEDVVATAQISLDGVLAEEKDLENTNQMVHFPGIQTTLVSTDAKDKISNSFGKISLTDTVVYKNLEEGESYTINGILMDKATEEALLDVNGEEIGASANFVAGEGGNGTVEIVFEFEAPEEGYSGKSVVAFEEIPGYATHADINDKNQTVDFPAIGTTARDNTTGIRNGFISEDMSIIDTVAYENLIPGNSYRLYAMLFSKDTEDLIFSTDGEELSLSNFAGGSEDDEITDYLDGTGIVYGFADFVPEQTSGTQDVEIRFNGTNLKILSVAFDEETQMPKLSLVPFDLKGSDLVVGEVLVRSNGTTVADMQAPIAKHMDIQDEGQTMHYPDGQTQALDADTQAQNAFAGPEQHIKDIVSYEGLMPETQYSVSGIIMVKDDEPYPLTDAAGQPYKTVVTFITPSAEAGETTVSGTVEVDFTVDLTGLAGKEIVVFEEISFGEHTIFTHFDINDKNQTVYIPDGGTTLVEKDSMGHMAQADASVVLIDTVRYENLLPNTEYTVDGILMDKETEEPLLIDGETVVAQATFTTPASEDASVSGETEIAFVFETTGLADKALVAFETVSLNGYVVFRHEDIHDIGQTVYIPDGGTTLVDSETEDHIANADEKVILVDTVSYKNLVPGLTYKVNGVLMDKETGKPVMVNNLPVMASAELVIEPSEDETVSGVIDIAFEFDGSALKGKTVVAFETVTYENVPVFVHADIEDEAQTVHFPNGGTEAKDSKTSTHTSMAEKEVRIVDTVSYENLLPGKEYTVEGVLMDKETGEPLMVDNKEVKAEAKFVTPEAEEEKDEPLKTVSGSVEVVFEFDGSALKGKTVVAFETVKMDGKEVLVHADIEDKAQSIYFPEIGTQARDKADNDQEVAANKDVVVVDKVSYKNLNPEMEYKVKGVLMDKHTGKALTVGGKEVSAEMTFKPEKTDGEVELEFKFNTTGLANQKFVVFEEVYEIVEKEEILVGEHKDINDEKQTIQVGDNPKTGDATNVAPYLFTILAAGAFVLFAAKLRRKADEQ